MEVVWVHRSGRERLVVFCNGWGMDARPFSAMSCRDCDVLMLYDYRRLDAPPAIGLLTEQYDQLILIGWSMGVWVGQQLFAASREHFRAAVAINGTLCPIDDRYGIPRKVFDETLADFSEQLRQKFYRRMCRDRGCLEGFLARQPTRRLGEQQEELAALKVRVDCQPADQSMYNRAIVADADFIVPTANQLRFWPERLVTTIRGHHFPFDLWPGWDELLAFIDAR